MIWQEGVCSIVCLTNLKEGTKVQKYMLEFSFPKLNIFLYRITPDIAVSFLLCAFTTHVNSSSVNIVWRSYLKKKITQQLIMLYELIIYEHKLFISIA